MGETTKIAWCDHTFNPWVGCTKVSPGCTHCYAESYDKRVGGHHKLKVPRWGVGAPRQRTTEANWVKPLRWNEVAKGLGVRRRVFCASLADVFDPDVPPEWRVDLFALIDRTPHLDWLLLTKRPERFQFDRPIGGWPKNVWLGVTVENQDAADRRIPRLLAEQVSVRFLSCEPLLERIDIERIVSGLTPTCERCSGHMSIPVAGGGRACPDCLDHQGFAPCPLDWVIIGGESGPAARSFNTEWAYDLLDQCRILGCAPFVKQMGSNAIASGNDNVWLLKMKDASGANPDEWPARLRRRSMPR